MDHVVDGLKFPDWVKAKPYRGEIIPVQDGIWSWWVEEANIVAVREELRPTGFVICI